MGGARRGAEGTGEEASLSGPFPVCGALLATQGDGTSVINEHVVTGDDDVFRKVRGDLDARNVELSDHLLRKQMDDLLATARQQIQAEG